MLLRNCLFTRPRLLWYTALVLILCGVGCDKREDTFFPLQADRHWHYTIARTTMDGHTKQKFLIQNLAPVVSGSESLARRRTVDGHEYFYRHDEQWIKRVAYQKTALGDRITEDPARIVLPRAPTENDHWRQESHTVVLENTGPPWETLFRITEPVMLDYRITGVDETVVVPAGKFTGCVVVQASGSTNSDIGNYIGHTTISVELTEWYAPAVGLIKSSRIEKTDAEALNYGELILELESYN